MHGESTIPARLGPITIRYLEPKDWDAYVTLDLDAPTMFYLENPAKRKTRESILATLRGYEPSHACLAIADDRTDSYVGRCGIFESGEIYVMLAARWHRQGVGKRVVAFLTQEARALGLRPHGVIHPDNAASVALVKRLGWVQTGVHQHRGDEPHWQDGHLIFEPSAGTLA